MVKNLISCGRCPNVCAEGVELKVLGIGAFDEEKAMGVGGVFGGGGYRRPGFVCCWAA